MKFASLYDAYSQYYWRATDPISGQPITRFADTEKLLTRLSLMLHQKIDCGDPKECRDTCMKILSWGGVLSKRSIAKSIKSCSDRDLVSYLRAIRVWLQSDPTSGDTFDFDGADGKLRLEVDSGTTKIYSLLSMDWIIYDGRVGSAIGLLVAKWAEEGANDVPPLLRFPHAHEKHRNPNTQKINVFPKMKNDDSRLMANLHANWLLREVVSGENVYGFSDMDESSRLRALEAALFMIGYDTTRPD